MRVLWLVVLTSCSEYGVHDADTGPGEPEAVCDGLDGDLDGFTDDGWPDADGDGIADCVDGRCELAPTPAEAVQVVAGCYAPLSAVLDPWETVVEWAWPGVDGRARVLHTPVVGSLTDDDLDGDADGDDVPDVVVVVSSPAEPGSGTLAVLDGATGEAHWTLGGFDPLAGPLVADIDADGHSEVVAWRDDGHAVALEADGEVLWTAARPAFDTYPHAAVADLDGDGRPEVIADTLILDGATGAELADLGIFGEPDWRMPSVADLDGDGLQEIALSTVLFDHTGEVLWEAPLGAELGLWSFAAQADADPEAEVVLVGGGFMAVWEADGTEVLQVPVLGDHPGPPCAADFDGDGRTEVAWGDIAAFQVRELDGSLAWERDLDEETGRAGCSAADLDADGAWEVIYADHESLWVLDGASGDTLARHTSHSSGTVVEYPAAVDVDADGSMELVVASTAAEGWGAVVVLGHVHSGWMRGPVTWHEHDFAGPDILPGGAVPARPEPWWTTWGTYRAATSPDDALADLRPEVADACAASCEEHGVVRLMVRVVNEGLADSGPLVPVALRDPDGEEVALRHLPEIVPSGGSLDVELVVEAGRLRPGMRVVVDGDEGERECDETDDAVTWDPPC